MKTTTQVIEKEVKTAKPLAIYLLLVLGVFSLLVFSSAAPTGPDLVNNTANSTKATTAGQILNISGGYIASVNLSATIQNPRWKAFVGDVSGSFTLDDASGSTIYDWSLSTLTGRVYATRNESTIDWTDVNCSNITLLESENVLMNHTNADDNITATFNTSSGATHSSFFVGTQFIAANSCPTLNTYVDNATQDSTFEEMALHDTYGTTIYAVILEDDSTGYNSNTYDFQMLVPENGAPGFSGATAYYLYVEVGV